MSTHAHPYGSMHRVEAPVRGRTAPDTHEDLLPDFNDPNRRPGNQERPKWRQRLMTGVAAIAVAGGIFGVSKAFGGEPSDASPNPTPTTSSEPFPTESQEPGGTLTDTETQLERQGMSYQYSNADLIGEDFLNDPHNPDNYVDRAAVRTVLDNLLNNMTVARETGNEDAILATYVQASPGFYGENTSWVEALRDQAAKNALQQAQDPNYPISNCAVTSIDSIQPLLEPGLNRLIITFGARCTTYGNAQPDGSAPVAFTQDRLETVTLNRQPQTGWSDGGERNMWLIAHETLLDSTAVSPES